jgi:hypothetical protein
VLCSEPLAMIALHDSVKVNGELQLVDSFAITGHLLTAYLHLRKEGGRKNLIFSLHRMSRPTQGSWDNDTFREKREYGAESILAGIS